MACAYIYIFVYRYVYICICICISLYKLLSPYNVVLMYIFSDDHLALDKQLSCSSKGMINSPAPIFIQLPVAQFSRVEIS